MDQEGSRALARALRYLSHRPYSHAELRQRLIRSFPPPVVEQTLASLENGDLLNDATFARLWTQSRETSSPRSRAMVAWELKQRGVSPDIVREATSGLQDKDSALRAAREKGRTLSHLDHETFHRRLAGYLLRRGFGPSLIERIVDRTFRDIKINDNNQNEEHE